MSSASDSHVWRPVENRRQRRRSTAAHSLHIGLRAFSAFGDETVDPRGNNRQRYRAELDHGIMESVDVEFRSERILRLFARARSRAPGAPKRSKPSAAALMHHKRLMMDQITLPELQQFAITRRPRLSYFQRRPFGFADRDHLFCMRARQVAAAGQSTALADDSKILAHLLLGFIHSRNPKEWQAERLPYNSFVGAIMHHNRLTMQETRRVGRESSARAPKSESDWYYVPGTRCQKSAISYARQPWQERAGCRRHAKLSSQRAARPFVQQPLCISSWSL
jgi:hypothetical protein